MLATVTQTPPPFWLYLSPTISACVVIATAGFVYWYTGRRTKRDRIWGLYQEFTGVEMLTARCRGENNLDSMLDGDDLQKMYNSDFERYLPIAQVVSFFVALHHLVQGRRIDERELASFFGEYIVWWHYRLVIGDRIPRTWVGSKQLSELFVIVDKHKREELGPNYERWLSDTRY